MVGSGDETSLVPRPGDEARDETRNWGHELFIRVTRLIYQNGVVPTREKFSAEPWMLLGTG